MSKLKFVIWHFNFYFRTASTNPGHHPLGGRPEFHGKVEALLTSSLSRQLTQFETDLLLYPRLCAVCLNGNQERKCFDQLLLFQGRVVYFDDFVKMRQKTQQKGITILIKMFRIKVQPSEDIFRAISGINFDCSAVPNRIIDLTLKLQLNEKLFSLRKTLK